MKKFLQIFAGFTIILALTFGLMLLNTEKFEGTWFAGGESTQENPSWYKNYTFEKGTYKVEGYPPISEVGTYKVLSENENSFELELNNDSGISNLNLNLSKDGSTLEINGTEFIRE